MAAYRGLSSGGGSTLKLEVSKRFGLSPILARNVPRACAVQEVSLEDDCKMSGRIQRQALSGGASQFVPKLHTRGQIAMFVRPAAPRPSAHNRRRQCAYIQGNTRTHAAVGAQTRTLSSRDRSHSPQWRMRGRCQDEAHHRACRTSLADNCLFRRMRAPLISLSKQYRIPMQN